MKIIYFLKKSNFYLGFFKQKNVISSVVSIMVCTQEYFETDEIKSRSYPPGSELHTSTVPTLD